MLLLIHSTSLWSKVRCQKQMYSSDSCKNKASEVNEDIMTVMFNNAPLYIFYESRFVYFLFLSFDKLYVLSSGTNRQTFSLHLRSEYKNSNVSTGV